MISTEQLNYAVVPDTHGQYEIVAKAVDALEPAVDTFIFLGDVIDGPDTRKLIGLVRDLGDKALTIEGNHEWACRNALAADEDPVTDIWRTEVWPGYEDRMLESYGLKRSADWQLNAARLREAMAESGDLDWLASLLPYIETPGFIAVHAGPDLISAWPDQAKYLDHAASPGVRREEEPAQIFSHGLAEATGIPASVDERTFVSGHSHLSLPRERRLAPGRIRLASKLAAGNPLFVWHSGENTIYQY